MLFKLIVKKNYPAILVIKNTNYHQKIMIASYRNGHNKKTLKSKYGNIDVAIPRDRNADFQPQLVQKR